MYIRNDKTGLWCRTKKKKTETKPLSNNIIHSEISDMLKNILEQLFAELDSTPFSFSM